MKPSAWLRSRRPRSARCAGRHGARTARGRCSPATAGRRFASMAAPSSHSRRRACTTCAASRGRRTASRALLVGNRGAVLLYDGTRFRELPSPTVENLRRVAWSPDGTSALIVGNSGAVIRFDDKGHLLTPLPGDRAHTMRSIAWRPDGAYAMIGASPARTPATRARTCCIDATADTRRRCSRRMTRTTRSRSTGAGCAAARSALILAVTYGPEDAVTNKLLTYDGAAIRPAPHRSAATLLGAGWAPDGSHAAPLRRAGSAAAPRRHAHRTRSRRTPATTSSAPSGARAPPSALFLRGPEEKVYTV